MNCYLDLKGKVCPIPLLLVKEKMLELKKGDKLSIDFDCNQAVENIPNWAAEKSYVVDNFERLNNSYWTISIIKK